MARANPLNWNIPIAYPDGRPTEEFQRAWQSQAQVNSNIPALDTAAEVSAVLDKIGDTPGSLLQRGASAWQLLTGANGDFVRRVGGVWQPQSTAQTVQDLLNQLSSTRGSVLYRGASGWAALGPGTAGQFLQTAGAGADPTWAAGGGGGGSAAIGARMYRSAGGQALTSGTTTGVTYDTVDYADAGFTCNAAAGTITVADAGYYVVSYNTRFTTTPTAFFVQAVLVNGSPTGSARGAQYNVQTQELAGATVIKLAAGDVVSTNIFAGAAVTTAANVNKSYTVLSIVKVGNSGGGGAGGMVSYTSLAQTTTTTSSAFATKGVLLVTDAPITLQDLRFALGSTTNGAQYVIRVVELSGSNVSVIHYTSPTLTWTTGMSASMRDVMASPVTLPAGRYAILVSYSNAASGTTVLPLLIASGAGGTTPFWYGMPVGVFDNQNVTLAALTVAVGNTLTVNAAGNTAFMLGARWRF